MLQSSPLWPHSYRRRCAFGPGRGLLAALLATVLAACGGGGSNAAAEQYLARLSRTLAVTPVPLAVPRVPALPAARDLHLQIASGKLDALDFLALSGCALQVTIGKRNSSLGRMARDSQRLLLELEFLQLAPACIALQRERGEAELAAALEQAQAHKRGQLPALLFNATLGGAEYRAFWKAPANPGSYPEGTSSAVLTSLEAINGHARRWLAGDFGADNREFELLLGKVATGDGGALLQALAAQADALATANGMLAASMERGPLCTPGFRPAAAAILDNVVRKYFVTGIQPRAAALNRRYHGLLPPVAALEQLLDTALPPAYRAWRRQRDRELVALAGAPRAHVDRLQAIRQPCETAAAQ